MRVYEGKWNVIGTNLTSHRRARKRKDSHFIRQQIVNKSGAYRAVLFVVALLDRLVRKEYQVNTSKLAQVVWSGLRLEIRRWRSISHDPKCSKKIRRV